MSPTSLDSGTRLTWTSTLSSLRRASTPSRKCPIASALAALRSAAQRCEPLPGEELSVEFESFDDSAIRYHVHVWIPASRFVQTRFDLRRFVWEEFRKNGVEMTYPHLNVHWEQMK